MPDGNKQELEKLTSEWISDAAWRRIIDRCKQVKLKLSNINAVHNGARVLT